jgi:hypothetical protein
MKTVSSFGKLAKFNLQADDATGRYGDEARDEETGGLRLTADIKRNDVNEDSHINT